MKDFSGEYVALEHRFVSMLPKHLGGFPHRMATIDLKGLKFQCFLSIWWDFHLKVFRQLVKAPSRSMFQCFLSIWWDFHSCSIWLLCLQMRVPYGRLFQCFLSIWWDFHERAQVVRCSPEGPLVSMLPKHLMGFPPTSRITRPEWSHYSCFNAS